MRPKARGLAQHSGPPGWLEDSNPAGVILYVMDGPPTCLFRTVPVVLTGATQLLADGLASCCYIVNVPYTAIRHELCHTRRAWPGTLVDPCLLSGHACVCCVGVLEGVVSYFPCVNTLGCLGRSTLLTSPQLPPAALSWGRLCTFVVCTMYNVHCTGNLLSYKKYIVVCRISAFSCLARAKL